MASRRSPSPPPAASRAGRVALVGRPNVGKSTLLNGLVGEHLAIVSHHPQTTRERVAGVVNDGPLQMVLVDTPGQHTAKNRLGQRMNQEVADAMAGADVIVLVSDVTETPTPTLPALDAAIAASAPPGKPVILVVSKIDRVKIKGDLLPVLAGRAAAFPFAAVVPLSAKKRDGLERLKQEIASRLPDGERLLDEEAISDRPSRFFVREYVREQVLRRTRQEVPHGVAVTIDRWEESPKLTRIDVTVHVDKESHKKIVLGERGLLMKDIGTRARERAEALLGQKIMLKIWVRVTPRWYESDKLLAEFGYGDEG